MSDIKQSINTSRSLLVDKIIKIRGQYFSFNGREYLRPIYDYANRSLLLKTGRQVEKSSTLCCISLLDMYYKSYFNVLYINYSGKQVSDFVNDKLTPIIFNSPKIRDSHLASSETLRRVMDKSLINGSHMYMRSVFRNAETVRGISADRVVFDECQNILADSMIVAEECLSHSIYKWKIYAGTTKTRNNIIESLWKNSIQMEWFIKCSSCNFYNYQDEKLIGKDSYICSKCGKSIDPRNGQWVVLNEEDFLNPDKTIAFRITQYMPIWTSFKDIKEKFERYPINLFYNEILGLPYDLAEQPITETDLRRSCDENFSMDIHFGKKVDNFVGIDWGSGIKSSTVITAGYYIGDVFKVFYAYRIVNETDTMKQLDIIRDIIKTLNPKMIFADWGFGQGLNDALIEEFERVFSVYYTEGGEGSVVRWDIKGRKYIVKRTAMMNNIFMLLKSGKIKFPKFSEMQSFFEDILNIYVDFRTTSGKDVQFYNHDIDKRDDFFHSLLYAVLAGIQYQKISL